MVNIHKWNVEDGTGPTLDHVLVGTLRNSKYVRWDFIPPLAGVNPHGPAGINGVTLVGIDGDTEKAGIGLKYYEYILNNSFPISRIKISSRNLRYFSGFFFFELLVPIKISLLNRVERLLRQ